VGTARGGMLQLWCRSQYSTSIGRAIVRIVVTSIFVSDQEQALRFYTETLGFVAKSDFPVGQHRWLTVVEPDAPHGVQLLLEPDVHPAVRPFKEALVRDRVPATSFAVDDVLDEFARLRELGVVFIQEPIEMGSTVIAIFDDTVGNLIQIAQRN
jgi:catechol 2,3-dioxygenase-like lactoylglutathione lyase family enzyme